MKTKTFKNRDFSCQFDNITLSDILKQTNKKEPGKQPKKSAFSFNTLEDNFLERMLELKPIVPNRYVWHVGREVYSYPDIEFDRFSIVSEGLLCRKSRCNAVFANNALTSIGSFFPFVDDGLNCLMFRDSFREDMTPYFDLVERDFWRIDTQAFNARWYIDPNLKDDANKSVKGESQINYICTTTDIPPHAIRLYTFDEDAYIKNLPKLMMTNSFLFPLNLLKLYDKQFEWVRRMRPAA